MSIVVAVKKGKDIVIGADTRVTFGSRKTLKDNMDESKIQRIGDVLFARTGWGLYRDILEDYFSSKKAWSFTSKLEVFRFFKKFWEVLKKDYSLVNTQCDDDDTPFGDLDSTFMIVTKKKIFYVSSNMSVTEFLKFHAMGSGSSYALGALHALYNQRLKAKDIAYRAVEAAMANNIYCGDTIEILKP
jgi:ATP-dependent protease HslVU (ClpYQ) peptidase subunit